jgi:hypothetical protein
VAQHRCNFYWKRAEATEDELYAGMRDSSGGMQLRRIVTKEYADDTYGLKLAVQEGDSTVDVAVATLDFDASDFAVSASPAGEANVALAYGTTAGTPAEGNHTHLIPFVRLEFDDTQRSTTSTVTYTTQVSVTFTLPSGTWTVEANGWGRFGHDAGGSGDFRLVIDGTAGSAATRSGPTLGAYPAGAASSKASVASGPRTVTFQFRSNTAGTSVMNNAHLIVNCYRTA